MITTKELMQRIKLPKQAREEVNTWLLPTEEYQQNKKLFEESNEEFFEQWQKKDNRYQWILAFYIQLACEVHEEYQRQDLAEKIFDDTLYDITIWAMECHRKYGYWGLEEAQWVALSLQRKLFRLGRLQFEPITLDKDLHGRDRTLKAGTKALNVHIPAGEKMEYEKCLESLKQAEVFFDKAYEVHVCDSWLLSPKLLEFVPADSNIARFQKLFEIAEVHYKFPQAEQRIFEDVREDKENYPENTTLRKKAKEYICAGHDIGIGIGFLEVGKIQR